MLKHCVIAMLKDDDRVTENIYLKNCLQSFRFIRRKAIHAMNSLPQNIEENAEGHGIRVG